MANRDRYEPESVLRYRRRLGSDADMRPSTFERFERTVRKAMARLGLSRAKALKTAKSARWNRAEGLVRRGRLRRRARHRVMR